MTIKFTFLSEINISRTQDPNFHNITVADLRHRDSTLTGQVLLGLLAGVGVGQVGVEVFVEGLRGLLGEVPPFAPLVKEPDQEDRVYNMVESAQLLSSPKRKKKNSNAKKKIQLNWNSHK